MTLQYIGKFELIQFIKSEISELETRDADTLFECIQDSLVEMNVLADEETLYSEIEEQLRLVSEFEVLKRV